MSREEAERERDRLAKEQPDSTWLVAERDGAWQVVKVGLKPADSATGEFSETKPKPPTSDDPRDAHMRNVGSWVGPG